MGNNCTTNANINCGDQCCGIINNQQIVLSDMRGLENKDMMNF